MPRQRSNDPVLPTRYASRPALVKKDLSAAHGLRNALANHDRAEKLLAAAKR